MSLSSFFRSQPSDADRSWTADQEETVVGMIVFR